MSSNRREGEMKNKDTASRSREMKDQDTASRSREVQLNPPGQNSLATEESTLVPESPPSPGRSQQIPELTITDLHTTTMSSRGGGGDDVAEPVGVHHSSSEDSDSSSSETLPELRYSTTHPVRTPQTVTSRTATAAQKVRFSRSTEQRERARHASSLITKSSENSNVEVGDISSIQLKLGLDAQVSQTRASVLATLYQNYLSELKSAQPAARKTTAGTSCKTRSSSHLKLKPRSQRAPKVLLINPLTKSPSCMLHGFSLALPTSTMSHNKHPDYSLPKIEI